MSTSDVATVVLAACAVGGAVVETVRLWSRWARGNRRLREELLGTDFHSGALARLTKLEELVCQIDQRTRQLEPNGGESLADRIERIEAKLYRT